MVKYALGYRVRKAYRAGDREALVVIADDFARTERLLKKFIKSFSRTVERGVQTVRF